MIKFIPALMVVAALSLAIVEPLSDDADTQAALRDLVSTVYG